MVLPHNNIFPTSDLFWPFPQAAFILSACDNKSQQKVGTEEEAVLW